MSRRRRWAAALALAAVAVGCGLGTAASNQDSAGETAPVVAGHVLRHRWVHYAANFQADGAVDRARAVLDAARDAGFNGLLIADVKLGRLDDGSLIDAYYENLQAVLSHARGLGLRVVVNTADFGYSESILWHDPHLAAGLPVRDAAFVVRDGVLAPTERESLRIENGDFERLPAAGDAFPGWAWQDAPGEATFVDLSESHGGRASLRMNDLGRTSAPHGNGRVHQRLSVAPYRYYHVSVWVKTEGFEGGDVRVLALGREPARTLQWNSVPVAPTQDWTRFDVTFNTLTHDEVLFYLGVWGGGSGTIWWDDASIEPGGFVNIVRRPGAPLSLRDADGRPVHEAIDVLPVVDERMGRAPWPGAYDLWHAPPEIRLTAGSRLAEGDLVQADYYHMATIYNHQVTASLIEPTVLEVVRGQLAGTRRALAAADAFGGWMLGYDEIRVGGWEEAQGRTPGQQLAENVTAVVAAARAIDPQAPLFTWSDMFDPTHNAAECSEPYYLVNGDWSGSWAGLPREVTVLNWNHQDGKRRASAEFFAGRGHRQILAGYYDAPPERFRDRAWLEELAGVPGIEGVLYTQWGSGYENLSAWATHVWGDAQWVTVPAPGTSAYLPALLRVHGLHPAVTREIQAGAEVVTDHAQDHDERFVPPR